MSRIPVPSSSPSQARSAIRKKIESELSRKRTISTTNNQQRRRGNKRSAQKGTVAALKPSPALTVPENITVAEASQLCAAKRTDCVLVVDDEEGLSGIFTAKDLAYRVTAEGLDPHLTPVHQIMTRNPMVTQDTTSATEALQLMSVLDFFPGYVKLNSLFLARLFFDSIGHEDTESMLSGSHLPPDIRALQSNTSLSQLHSPLSEVHPNDSASVVDDESAVSYHNQKGTPSISAPPPVDDGTYVFKFRTPSGRTHRFQSRHDNVEHLREIVAGKLTTDPFFTEFQSTDPNVIPPDPIDFLLSYTDADGDTVLITSDHDVSDAVKIARSSGSDRVVLFVQGGKAWEDAGARESEAKAAQTTAAAKKEIQPTGSRKAGDCYA
ncbi:hypothetical protein C8R42DRAFT_643061 [Lentinula raphanica]|nr:hypothetical protein C8R42DRAFT_643061 [Lentinula raphanica]